MYSNCCCSYWFELEIIKKIGQSSHMMCSSNILNSQESTTNLNACTKKSGNLLKVPRIYNPKKYVYISCRNYVKYSVFVTVIGTHKISLHNIEYLLKKMNRVKELWSMENFWLLKNSQWFNKFTWIYFLFITEDNAKNEWVPLMVTRTVHKYSFLFLL